MRSNKTYEREYANMMCNIGHCERIAGSGSAKQSVADCILIKDGQTFLVEIKATKASTLNIRASVREQLERMQQKARENGVQALLAVRFKGKGWQQVDITNEIPKSVNWQ